MINTNILITNLPENHSEIYKILKNKIISKYNNNMLNVKVSLNTKYLYKNNIKNEEN